MFTPVLSGIFSCPKLEMLFSEMLANFNEQPFKKMD
jgi:hypothetical protein